jgi:hypothetical protein
MRTAIGNAILFSWYGDCAARIITLASEPQLKTTGEIIMDKPEWVVGTHLI